MKGEKKFLTLKLFSFFKKLFPQKQIFPVEHVDFYLVSLSLIPTPTRHPPFFNKVIFQRTAILKLMSLQ